MSAERFQFSDLIKLDLPNKTLLRPDEVAGFFGVSRQTVYDWCEVGLLTACNPNGRAVRIFRESIIRMLKDTMR